MEQQNKYYTPDISDLRVGYECEVNLVKSGTITNQDKNGNTITEYTEPDWKKIVIKDYTYLEVAIVILLPDNRLRVPYLTSEQIEHEGWVEYNDARGDMDQPWNISYKHKNNDKMVLNWFPRIEDPGYKNISGNIVVYEDYNKQGEAWSHNKKCRYSGECKSINELRFIQKLLGI